jgi:DNA-nicking Smr family endonuclease
LEKKADISHEAKRIFEDQIKIISVFDKDSVKQKKSKKNNAELDLHGFTLTRAMGKLSHFIESSSKKGINRVTIITGKGGNSPGIYSPLAAGLTEFMETHYSQFKLVKKDGVMEICLKD